MIDIVGAEKLVKTGHPCNVLFICPPSIDVLRSRLEKRGTESKEKIQVRIDTASKEIEKALKCDFINHRLENDDFDTFYRDTLLVLNKLYPFSIN